MPNILNIDRLKKMQLNTCPFQWGTSGELLELSVLKNLERDFPNVGYVTNSRVKGSDKTYRLSIRTALETGKTKLDEDGLSGEWRILLEQLFHPYYREALSHVCNKDLSDCLMEILFVRYDQNDWLSPHTDKSPKVATQLFYFCGDWNPEWGGHLSILGDGEARSVIQRVAPTTGMSAVIVRSDKSWHAVEPVTAQAPRIRSSLQVNFWAHHPPAPDVGREFGKSRS